MDISIAKNLSKEQVEQVYKYLQREPSMQDYLQLYPDYENRFPVLLRALPESILLDLLAGIDQILVPENDREKLIHQFELTGAEAKLSLLLLAGHSPAEIADVQKISRNTVRNQMQNIYDKTMTRKQPELIRRLHDVLDEK